MWHVVEKQQWTSGLLVIMASGDPKQKPVAQMDFWCLKQKPWLGACLTTSGHVCCTGGRGGGGGGGRDMHIHMLDHTCDL